MEIIKRFITNKRVLNRYYANAQARTLVTEQRDHQNEEKSATFSKYLLKKKEEAERSVLIQIASKDSLSSLCQYTKRKGLYPMNIFYYKIKEDMKLALVEFESVKCVHQVLNMASFIDKYDCIPITSRLLWFKGDSKVEENVEVDIKSFNLAELELTNKKCVDEILNGDNNPSSSMLQIYNLLKVSDIEVRIRFFICQQLKDMLSGLFPRCEVVPFGSSVNGFGQGGCDLDMVLLLNPAQLDSRFIFHSKQAIANPRYQNQKYMELLGDMLSQLIPGCSHVVRILRARVPIIKFKHQFGGIECDLSMDSDSGVFMSELLWLMTRIDSRVAPLVFMVKKWAKYTQLTSEVPGRWISNFALTILVLFHLQNRPQPVLPSFQELKELVGPGDHCESIDGLDCTFQRDASLLKKSSNSESLHKLLEEFFRFYAGFTWSKLGVSLVLGKIVNKPDFSPMYIENPLDNKLNVSQNVSLEEVDRFTDEITSALWRIECSESVNEDYKWTLKTLLSSHKPVDSYSFGEGRVKLDRLLKVDYSGSKDSQKPSDNALLSYLTTIRTKKKKKTKKSKNEWTDRIQ